MGTSDLPDMYTQARGCGGTYQGKLRGHMIQLICTIYRLITCRELLWSKYLLIKLFLSTFMSSLNILVLFRYLARFSIQSFACYVCKGHFDHCVM